MHYFNNAHDSPSGCRILYVYAYYDMCAVYERDDCFYIIVLRGRINSNNNENNKINTGKIK